MNDYVRTFHLSWVVARHILTFIVVVSLNYRRGRTDLLFFASRLMIVFILWPVFVFIWLWGKRPS